MPEKRVVERRLRVQVPQRLQQVMPQELRIRDLDVLAQVGGVEADSQQAVEESRNYERGNDEGAW